MDLNDESPIELNLSRNTVEQQPISVAKCGSSPVYYPGASGISISNGVLTGPENMTISKPKTEGYVFIIRQNKKWTFVGMGSYDKTLFVSSIMPEIFPTITEEMLTFWKHVVINNQYDWDEGSIDRKTLKLIKVNFDLNDVTAELFPDESSKDEHNKFAALSKLSSTEAKLLEIEESYSVFKMFHSGTNYEDDALETLKTLRDNTENLIATITQNEIV